MARSYFIYIPNLHLNLQINVEQKSHTLGNERPFKTKKEEIKNGLKASLPFANIRKWLSCMNVFKGKRSNKKDWIKIFRQTSQNYAKTKDKQMTLVKYFYNTITYECSTKMSRCHFLWNCCVKLNRKNQQSELKINVWKICYIIKNWNL